MNRTPPSADPLNHRFLQLRSDLQQSAAADLPVQQTSAENPTGGSGTRDSVFYLHLLRCLASIAVVAIHVAGPFRELWGLIPDSQWLAAIAANSQARWAVPIFMMITGALLLSDPRPFDPEHYVRRRLLRTVIPFAGWSLIYLAIRGVGDDPWQALLSLNRQPAWYHLWFFYDFIPLYFVIPLLLPLRERLRRGLILPVLLSWSALTLWDLLASGSSPVPDLLLYSGYLLLGWYLFNRDNRRQLRLWVLAGLLSLAAGFFGSWWLTASGGEYSIRFMGYKGLNTLLVAGMLFVVLQTQGNRLRGRIRQLTLFISCHSLGIYLLHPLLLIPVRNLENGIYELFGHNLVAIPLLTLLVVAGSLLLSWLLSRTPLLRWLVPN